jgi:hypothetical protein
MRRRWKAEWLLAPSLSICGMNRQQAFGNRFCP